MFETFVKSYAPPTANSQQGCKYKYTAMVRHKGTVIVFGMDDQRRISYSVLDLSSPPDESEGPDATTPPAPFDSERWTSPALLTFPNEIAQVGFGVADQLRLPVVRVNGTRLEDPDTTIVEAGKRDLFLSTTARLSALAPFQVLSDGQYVYLFRQAISEPDNNVTDDKAEQAREAMLYLDDMGRFIDGEGNKVTGGAGVPIVNGTLLVDRFLLAGAALELKREVRFQRSRSKSRPASRKDSLGSSDLDGAPFYEPTQELSFLGDLDAGRFAVLLLPTEVPGAMRWQIFACNRRTGLIDSYDVERSHDGLFNTRGSQVYTCPDHDDVFALEPGTCVEPATGDPTRLCGKDLIVRVSASGSAEAALDFEAPDGTAHVTFDPPVALGAVPLNAFTLEAWIYPRAVDRVEPQVLIDGGGEAKGAGPSLWIQQQTKLRVGFGDGATWCEHTTTSGVLELDKWNHIAVTFDGTRPDRGVIRYFVNGALCDFTRKMTVSSAGNGNERVEEPIGARRPANASNVSIVGLGAAQHSFAGIIDEVRLWGRARGAREINLDRGKRLVGLEPGLVSYWRLDEGRAGAVGFIYDQVSRAGKGELKGACWKPSDAPVGESAGLSRSSFQIGQSDRSGAFTGRQVATGLSALLYFQQELSPSGYSGAAKPLKQSGRVMLAVGTCAAGKNEIAVLDFGVSRSGKLALAPDTIALKPVTLREDKGSINDQLDTIAAAQAALRMAEEEVVAADRLLEECTAEEADADELLEECTAQLNEAVARLDPAVGDPGLPPEQAKVRIFSGLNYGGTSYEYGVGEVTCETLLATQFNDKVRSMKVPLSLEVTVYEHINKQGRRSASPFTGNVSDVGSDWRHSISHLTITTSALYNTEIKPAEERVANADKTLRQRQDRVARAGENLVEQKKRRDEAQRALERAQKDLENPSAPMGLVHTDQAGLTLVGGILPFAWTNDTPLLFDSATGKLALYFRGTAGQLFVAYYNTLTERACYNLVGASDRPEPPVVVKCVARSTAEEMDEIEIDVAAETDSPGTCKVTVSGPGIEETWARVPRAPADFADVLNGQAGGRDGNRRRIGYGTLVAERGRPVGLSLDTPLASDLPVHTTLLVGDYRVTVAEAAGTGAQSISVSEGAPNPPIGRLPVFRLAYDYSANASASRVPADLFNGSLLVRATAVDTSLAIKLDQGAVSGGTLSCEWVAEIPGGTLTFDGVGSYGRPVKTGAEASFAVEGDVTIEAWARPIDLTRVGRIVTQQSGSDEARSCYTLGLETHVERTAIVLDGVDDYIELKSGVNLDLPEIRQYVTPDLYLVGVAGIPSFTQEVWIYPTPQDDARHGILGLELNSAGPSFGISIKDKTKITAEFSSDGTPWSLTTDTGVLTLDAWNHVAVTANADGYVLYVNGARREWTKAGAGNMLPLDSINVRYIGRVGNSYFPGRIDEVRLWRHVREQADIQADMYRRLGGREAGLAGYWRFADGKASDYSPAATHGTLHGSDLLMFDGVDDAASIPKLSRLSDPSNLTVEARVRPRMDSGTHLIVAGRDGAESGLTIFLRIKNGKYEGGFEGSGKALAMEIPPEDLYGDSFVTLSLALGGGKLKLYRNGMLGPSDDISPPKAWRPGELTWLVAGHPSRMGLNFKGEIDEVRLWSVARPDAEILKDHGAVLAGNEAGLVGCWRLKGTDRANLVSKSDPATLVGSPVVGAPSSAPSPIPVYSAFAGAGDLVATSAEHFYGGSWTHLAAVYNQAYALKFAEEEDYLDCGKDSSLDLTGDLTIEAFINAESGGQVILARGVADGRVDDGLPYCLMLTRNRRLVFSFQDTTGKMNSFLSDSEVGQSFCKVAVVREYKTEREDLKGEDNKTVVGVKVKAWHEVRFYIDGRPAGSDRLEGGEDATQPPSISSSDKPLLIGAKLDILASKFLQVLLVEAKLESLPSHMALPVILRGEAKRTLPGFRGTISEVRIWSAARPAAAIGAEIRGAEKGLVSWWRLEEGKGRVALDSKSRNHATLRGSPLWVRDPNPLGSSLTLYRDGRQLPAAISASSPLLPTAAQFTLGASRCGAAPAELFQGELEELRVWRTRRTEEQIQDNMFRRLMGDDRDDLIAYYTFDPPLPDAEPQSVLGASSLPAKPQTRLANHSPHRKERDLLVEGVSYVYSTAPIGDDAPQVRNALAGVGNAFQAKIESAPAVQEYGDMQLDSEGALIGVFKRCYAYVEGGKLTLIAGFKVGEMVTEWVGQVQTAPTLIGYIEGAPPVPGENLSALGSASDEPPDVTGASSVALVRADETTYTYSSERDKGFDMEVEGLLAFGFKSGTEAGAFVYTSVEDSQLSIGGKFKFEHSLGWLEGGSTGVGRTTTGTTSMSLRGSFDARALGGMRRFVPENMGLALVKSETADIFALRLRHSGALISFQMRPNPDIEPDWNIITFPLNPRYVHQGSLDGKVGLEPDPNYPNALTYSPDSSYFKPIEAYALKSRIKREEAELESLFAQYDAGGIGRRQSVLHFGSADLAVGRSVERLPRYTRRNIVNTYVWTAAGGLYAETQGSMDMQTEMVGGSYQFKGLAGLEFKMDLALLKVRGEVELSALFGGHLNLTVQKSREARTSFELNVDVGGVASDINERDGNATPTMDRSDPRNPRPKRTSGLVDAYRFMSFYLEPSSVNRDVFAERVVDPIWLQTGDPGAAALREAISDPDKTPCWRILHRVTFVSRVLAEPDPHAPPSLEKSLQTLDIDSNYELIKRLEPFVLDCTGDFREFEDAVHDAVDRYLPELRAYKIEIAAFMAQYYGVADSTSGGSSEQPDEAAEAQRTPDLAPVVNAGPDVLIDRLDPVGRPFELQLSGLAMDDRTQPDALFARWEQLPAAAAEPEGELVTAGEARFSDPNELQGSVWFTSHGRYRLRLTASDGALSGSDELVVTVNDRATVRLSATVFPGNRMQALLSAELIDAGLGHRAAGTVKGEWSVARGPTDDRTPEVSFEPGALTWRYQTETAAEPDGTQRLVLSPAATQYTTVNFTERGNYLLRLTVRNGTVSSSTVEIELTVNMRVTDDLVALYAFREGACDTVCDIANTDAPLDLTIGNPAAVQRLATGGLRINAGHPDAERTRLITAGPAARLFDALAGQQGSDALTVEAWITPACLDHQGLGRIITFSNGPAERNFTVGQSRGMFYVDLRTTTSQRVGDRALSAGQVTDRLTHLVVTRDDQGQLRVYLDGTEVARRPLSGTLAGCWSSGFALALGGEGGAGPASSSRAWAGTYHLVAIYRRALGPDEVRQNFDFGADEDMIPLVDAGADAEIDLADGRPTAVTLQGRVADDRPLTDVSRRIWKLISGPSQPTLVPDGEPISSPNGLLRRAAPASVTFERSGTYVYSLTATDGAGLRSGDQVTIVVNQPPSFELAPVAPLKLTGDRVSATIDATVTESGRGAGESAAALTYRWRFTNGPAPVSVGGTPVAVGVGGTPTELFAGGEPGVGVTFSQHGSYTFDLTVHNGRLAATRSMTLTVNTRPTIDVGAPRIVQLPASLPAPALDRAVGADTPAAGGEEQSLPRATLQLPEAVIRTGLADPAAALLTGWSLHNPAEAPAPVEIRRTDKGGWEAVFTRSGLYTLRFTAGEGELEASADLPVTVNRAPLVTIVKELAEVELPATVQLEAVVSDDGQPALDGKLALEWTAAGPAEVSFADRHAEFTTASFTRSGTYELTLTASDGYSPASDSTTITVRPWPRIASGLVALFRFDGEDKTKIVNTAPGATPLVLSLDPDKAESVEKAPPGLRIIGEAVYSSGSAPAAIIEAIKASQQVTIEAWIRPAVARHRDEFPHRIVTISQDGQSRNVTLEQTGSGYKVRFRTRPNDPNGGANNLEKSGVATTAPTHLVFTCDLAAHSDRLGRLYINGQEEVKSTNVIDGSFDAWDAGESYPLMLANEGGGDRAWYGEYYLVAIYARCLEDHEVLQNFQARY